jgi:hypothetical protein
VVYVPPLGHPGAPRDVEEIVGIIDGAGALEAPYPQTLLHDRVLAEMPVFRNMTAGYLIDNKATYRRLNEWVLGIPHALEDAEKRLRRAVSFFETSNLRLAELARDPSDRRVLQSLKWNDAAELSRLNRQRPGR